MSPKISNRTGFLIRLLNARKQDRFDSSMPTSIPLLLQYQQETPCPFISSSLVGLDLPQGTNSEVLEYADLAVRLLCVAFDISFAFPSSGAASQTSNRRSRLEEQVRDQKAQETQQSHNLHRDTAWRRASLQTRWNALSCIRAAAAARLSLPQTIRSLLLKAGDGGLGFLQLLLQLFLRVSSDVCNGVDEGRFRGGWSFGTASGGVGGLFLRGAESAKCRWSWGGVGWRAFVFVVRCGEAV